MKFYADRYPHPEPYVRRFFEVAESAPQDQAAVDCLIWIARFGGCDPGVNRAVQRLATHHASNRRLGRLAGTLDANLVFSLATSAEDLYRAIIAENPDRAIQGQTSIFLAEYLRREAHLVRSLQGDTQMAKTLRRIYQSRGADMASYQAVRGWNPDELAKRSKETFERAEKDYADVRDFLHVVDPSVLDKLFANPELALDKPAPEITGEEVGGSRLKLADFKGKVVVLFFWGDWCQACRAMYPLARSLVKRMEGKPFVLLGINSDKDRIELRRRIEEDDINWRSWWDGGGDHGPIAGQFKIPAWPTFYILDHRGTIRYKFLGVPRDDEYWSLDKVLDEMTIVATKESTAPPPTAK